METYKNIIFDLGGVVINLDTMRSLKALSRLTGLPAAFDSFRQYSFFAAHERGNISDADYRNAFRKTFDTDFDDRDFDTAWCEMLLDIPTERIDLIKKLRQSRNLYVLSNTNQIHINVFLEKCKNAGAEDFEALFEKVWYSHRLGCRKPEAEIYQKIIALGNLKPEETVFADDNLENLEAAAACGLGTVHIGPETDILKEFGHLV